MSVSKQPGTYPSPNSTKVNWWQIDGFGINVSSLDPEFHYCVPFECYFLSIRFLVSNSDEEPNIWPFDDNLWSSTIDAISWILHAFLLVLTYDLLEDRPIDDVTINNILLFLTI